MGKPRYIYFSEEISKKLDSVENKSELINNLLAKHFELQGTQKMTKEEIERRIKILEIQIEADKKIEELGGKV